LWGSLKDEVYETSPHTVEELRNNTRRYISAISGEKLQEHYTNVFCRYTKYIRSGEQHFQHLLLQWLVFIALSKGHSHCDSLAPS
jgi:hypothetical protein